MKDTARDLGPRVVPFAFGRHHIGGKLARLGVLIHFSRLQFLGHRRRGERRLIAVLQEAALRVLELRELVKTEVALPFRFGVRAVDRFCPIELRGSFRDGAVVHVEDVAAGVGDHGIEHRQVAGPHGLLEFGHALRPSHGVSLVDRPAFFQLGQADGERLAIADGDQGALVGLGEAEPTT